MASDGDWQMIGQLLVGPRRVMLHQRDGKLRLKVRLVANRDPESGRRTDPRTPALSVFFDSPASKEFGELRELLDRAATCQAHPDDCPNGPEPHPFVPDNEDVLPCCRQPWEDTSA